MAIQISFLIFIEVPYPVNIVVEKDIGNDIHSPSPAVFVNLDHWVGLSAY